MPSARHSLQQNPKATRHDDDTEVDVSTREKQKVENGSSKNEQSDESGKEQASKETKVRGPTSNLSGKKNPQARLEAVGIAQGTKAAVSAKTPLPRYLITHCAQRDYLSACDEIEIWQLRTSDPEAQFPNLTKAQQQKVSNLFKDLKHRSPFKFTTLWDNDIEFLGEGGQDCGADGERGLSEFTYLMETIAWRMSPDRTEVKRQHIRKEEGVVLVPLPGHTPGTLGAVVSLVMQDILTTADLTNGTIAFVRVLE